MPSFGDMLPNLFLTFVFYSMPILVWGAFIKKRPKKRTIILVVVVYGIVTGIVMKTIQFMSGDYDLNVSPSFFWGIINYLLLKHRCKNLPEHAPRRDTTRVSEYNPEITAERTNEPDLIHFVSEDEMLKSKKDRLEKWDKVSKITLRFIACIVIVVAAFAFTASKLYNMRYIETTKTGDNFINVHVVDTWTKQIKIYHLYYDQKQEKWMKEFVDWDFND